VAVPPVTDALSLFKLQGGRLLLLEELTLSSNGRDL
jgi:hypothetical protein